MKAKHPNGIPPFKSPEGWAKPAKVSHLFKGEGEQKRLVGIKVETTKEIFVVPVLDVRHDGLVKRFEKQSRISAGSKFFKPSYSVLGYSYNVSRK